MNDPQKILDSLIFISLPESMHKEIGSFALDPTIMLPVETGAVGDDLDLGSLSWEMIISGMLKILAWDRTNEHAEYYRSFVLAVKPDIIDELTRSGIVKAGNRDWDIAEELFLALAGLQPGDPRATLNLALMYDQRSEGYKELENTELQKEYADLAFSAYIRALGEKPELPETHLYAGHFFLRQQSWGRAKKEFTRFLEISRDEDKKREISAILEQIRGSSDRDALFNEAFDFIRLGKEAEGLEKIEEFLRLQDDVWNAWFLKGWALRRLERYGEAYEAFSAARARGGDSSDLLNELAICAMELERYQESISLLETALEKTPGDVKLLSNIGICQVKLGNLEEAQEFFLRVLDADENDQIALQYLQHIEERL
jgi:tetratricopeptide (TPR) repeat protein